jgi:hypothetical protein
VPDWGGGVLAGRGSKPPRDPPVSITPVRDGKSRNLGKFPSEGLGVELDRALGIVGLDFEIDVAFVHEFCPAGGSDSVIQRL